MLHHALAASSSDSTDHLKLRAEDTSSAGDNLTFLASKLTWEVDDEGRERVLDEDGNGWVSVAYSRVVPLWSLKSPG